ncbi:hypothetical protein B5V01_33050 [Mesorhizobium erdmanii]|uniref:Uncharacterized protein n=2 Tax=Mesorhizobium TaxID=68287 RepID=A0A3M9XI66_9HYPH|nr:hypothetical protein DNR46_04380 [Mesorhizobium japonicum]RXT33898.1 hypothetical protein B5V01_33050 [Mesorhizobium erdmanii]
MLCERTWLNSTAASFMASHRAAIRFSTLLSEAPQSYGTIEPPFDARFVKTADVDGMMQHKAC